MSKQEMPKTDFNQLLRVLQRQRPDRPVLFELGVNFRLTQRFAEPGIPEDWSKSPTSRFRLYSDRNLGFDATVVHASGFSFPKPERAKEKSVSHSEGGLISDRDSFRQYPWPNPDDFSCTHFATAKMPPGMKVIVWAPGGVLENAIQIVGFNQLCYLLAEEPQLLGDIFDAIGSRILRYFEPVLKYDCVGAAILNDDWGFRTQTMLSPADMRRYVIPWHKKIVAVMHAANKPAILHSCGNLEAVMEDVIEVIGFDAKHSFEDAILPVEAAYEKYGRRIAILGGIDVDFLCRAGRERIFARSRAMLQRAGADGGYALGSGNSVPDYVPDENFLSLVQAAQEG